MGKLIGYARVSTGDQNVQLQLDALKQAGCKKGDIFVDTESGARSNRPGLDACIATLEPGDWTVFRDTTAFAHQHGQTARVCFPSASHQLQYH